MSLLYRVEMQDHAMHKYIVKLQPGAYPGGLRVLKHPPKAKECG